jgi:drug/metabolite transporter (DMT)-like permease
MTQDLQRGAAFAIAAALAFAAMGAAIKFAAAELPNTMVVFLRNGFGLLILAPWLLRPGLRGLATRRPLAHLLRAAVGLAAMYCFFFAIARLDLASAVLLNYSQPLFIPFIAWLWVREQPPARLFPAVVIGFAGVVLILKPDAGLVSFPGLVGLASGLLAATAMVAIRRMADTEPTTRIVFYFTVFGTLISAVPAAATWQAPGAAAWLAMLAAGALATAGQLSLTRAYTLAPAAHVGSLIYAAVVFAAVFGWLFWGEAPGLPDAAGTLLVILAGVIVVMSRNSATNAVP